MLARRKVKGGRGFGQVPDGRYNCLSLFGAPEASWLRPLVSLCSPLVWDTRTFPESCYSIMEQWGGGQRTLSWASPRCPLLEDGESTLRGSFILSPSLEEER